MTCQDYRSKLTRYDERFKYLTNAIESYKKHTEDLRHQIEQKTIVLDEEISMHEYFRKEKDRIETQIRLLQINVRNVEDNNGIHGSIYLNYCL